MTSEPSRFRAGLIGAIRFFLAVVFITYGVVKLAGGQFYYGDWTISKETVGGPFLVWAFYGYSPFYGRVVGLFELIPGIMLLFRRTTTIGAAALFAASLNITLMDFAYDFPGVKYAAAFYTLLLGVLLLDDWRKWRLMFLTKGETTRLLTAAEQLPLFNDPRRPLSTGAKAAFAFLGVPFLLFVANLFATSMDAGPEAPAKDFAVKQGYPAGSLELKRSRYTGLYGLGRTAFIEFSVKDAPDRVIRVNATKATGFHPWTMSSLTIDSAAGR